MKTKMLTFRNEDETGIMESIEAKNDLSQNNNIFRMLHAAALIVS